MSKLTTHLYPINIKLKVKHILNTNIQYTATTTQRIKKSHVIMFEIVFIHFLVALINWLFANNNNNNDNKICVEKRICFVARVNLFYIPKGFNVETMVTLLTRFFNMCRVLEDRGGK